MNFKFRMKYLVLSFTCLFNIFKPPPHFPHFTKKLILLDCGNFKNVGFVFHSIPFEIRMWMHDFLWVDEFSRRIKWLTVSTTHLIFRALFRPIRSLCDISYFLIFAGKLWNNHCLQKFWYTYEYWLGNGVVNAIWNSCLRIQICKKKDF